MDENKIFKAPCEIYDPLDPYPNIGHIRDPIRRNEIVSLASSNPFITDQIRLYESKGLRRLQGKAQVFTNPENSHIRNREKHTNEVLSISMLISELLGLNNELCRAIALGHDIGHPPYGHLGEEMLTELGGMEFNHAVFGVVLCQYFERYGNGLNLTRETLEGILRHSTGNEKFGYRDIDEYTVVRCSDKIAYIFSDLNDVERLPIQRRIENFEEIQKYADLLGKNQAERVVKVVGGSYDRKLRKRICQFRRF